MSVVVRVPISPSPNYLNRMVALALSARAAGGVLGNAQIEAFVSPDRPRPPDGWIKHLADYGIEWIDVPANQFEIHSYGATGIERFRTPTNADTIVMSDADLVFPGGLDEPVTQCTANETILGVTAYRSPFTPRSYPARATLDRRSCWTDLFARLRLEAPALLAVHPAAYEHDWEPDVAQCPHYFNYGMLILKSDAAATLGDALYDEHRLIVEHFSGAHAGQLAFSAAMARHGLAAEQLPIKYNFPNQEPYVDAYPKDFEDIRVLHYMSPNGFAKESDMDSAVGLRSWIRGSHADRIHTLLSQELAKYIDALDDCPWNEN